MWDCKINQNMEIGDIIFYLLGILFLVFSFFNSTRKRKRREMEQEEAASKRDFQHEYDNQRHEADDEEDWWMKPSSPQPQVKTSTVAPAYVKKEFQSSIDLATDFTKESSLRGSIFVDDGNFGTNVSTITPEKRGSRKVRKPAVVHPLVRELVNEPGTEELKKGLIYSEIFQRRY